LAALWINKRRRDVGKYIVAPGRRGGGMRALLLIVATDTFRGALFGPDRLEATLGAAYNR
jgi:hypothetical protein